MYTFLGSTLYEKIPSRLTCAICSFRYRRVQGHTASRLCQRCGSSEDRVPGTQSPTSAVPSQISQSLHASTSTKHVKT
jgi:hypothetical protein